MGWRLEKVFVPQDSIVACIRFVSGDEVAEELHYETIKDSTYNKSDDKLLDQYVDFINKCRTIDTNMSYDDIKETYGEECADFLDDSPRDCTVDYQWRAKIDILTFFTYRNGEKFKLTNVN